MIVGDPTVLHIVVLCVGLFAFYGIAAMLQNRFEWEWLECVAQTGVELTLELDPVKFFFK